MSERNWLYNPRELLRNASDSYAKTPEELSKLAEYRELEKKIKSVTTDLSIYQEMSQFDGPDHQYLHETCVQGIASSQQQLEILNKEASDLAFSETLQPVVQRAYEVVYASWLQETREKIQQQKTAILLTPEPNETYSRISPSTSSEIVSDNVKDEYVYKQSIGSYVWDIITGPLFPFLFRISPVLIFVCCVLFSPHKSKNNPPKSSKSVSAVQYEERFTFEPQPTFESLVIPTFDYESFRGILSIDDNQNDNSITFVTSPTSVYPGSYPTVKIKGKPYTTYSITVRYSSGLSSAAGLVPKQSNAEGYVIWSWKVGTNTYAGSYPITVSGGGQEKTIYFDVLP